MGRIHARAVHCMGSPWPPFGGKVGGPGPSSPSFWNGDKMSPGHLGLQVLATPPAPEWIDDCLFLIVDVTERLSSIPSKINNRRSRIINQTASPPIPSPRVHSRESQPNTFWKRSGAGGSCYAKRHRPSRRCLSWFFRLKPITSGKWVRP